MATVDDPGGNLWPLHDRNHRQVQLQQQQFAVAIAELLEDARRRRRWMMAAVVVVCGGRLLWEVAVLLLPAPVPKRAAERKQSGMEIETEWKGQLDSMRHGKRPTAHTVGC